MKTIAAAVSASAISELSLSNSTPLPSIQIPTPPSSST